MQGYAGLPVNVNGLMFDYRADIESAGASLPAREALLHRRRLGQQRVHRPVAAGPVRAACLGGRSQTALGQARHDAHRSRKADGRCTREGLSVRARSALARAQLQQQRSARRVGLRPDHRPRPLRHPVECAEDQGGQEEEGGDGDRLRQPGDEKREHRRGERAPEHELQAGRRSPSSTSPRSRGSCRSRTPACARRRGSPSSQARRRSSHRPSSAMARRRSDRESPTLQASSFTDWKVAKASKGKHVLRATVRDARGRTATARRIVRVCK